MCLSPHFLLENQLLAPTKEKDLEVSFPYE